jgi:hypothetical protein
MNYKVHKLDIKLDKEQDKLERFLNGLKGEVVSVVPNVSTLFLFYGAKTTSVLIVEKTKS